MEMNGQTRGRHSFSSRGGERDSGVEAQRLGFIKLATLLPQRETAEPVRLGDTFTGCPGRTLTPGPTASPETVT
ncbi:hypothetical protein EYF80_031996 [Liparis tanakae]|uniref:Uncharacterized protein n=1 Tax=Liparis tanakae TaxID=230148 RepID=A0A4Z2GYT3_9TELE|nr:hypothetical protein EYF80_031996 [Liparis tanakae]